MRASIPLCCFVSLLTIIVPYIFICGAVQKNHVEKNILYEKDEKNYIVNTKILRGYQQFLDYGYTINKDLPEIKTRVKRNSFSEILPSQTTINKHEDLHEIEFEATDSEKILKRNIATVRQKKIKQPGNNTQMPISNQGCAGYSQPCNDPYVPCCHIAEGVRCWEGTCQNCTTIREKCSDKIKPCCNRLGCFRKQCLHCILEGETCNFDFTLAQPCCPGSYCNRDKSKCIKCSTHGGHCSANEECCNTGEACHQGSCKTCVPPESVCDEKKPCCAKSKCTHGHCVYCEEEKGYCGYGLECCEKLACRGNGSIIRDSICIHCLDHGQQCNTSRQCCNTDGSCYGGKCRTCAINGQRCTLKNGCCDENNDCTDGICQKCGLMGESCGKVECCLGSYCRNGKCGPCTEAGKSCATYKECCCGTLCLSGTCGSCFGSCVSVKDCPCHDFLCINKYCIPCSASTGPCLVNEDCCNINEGCFDGSCSKCTRTGKPCGPDIACCGAPDEFCEEGVCRRCAIRGGNLCSRIHPCCKERQESGKYIDHIACFFGQCKYCTKKGETCAGGITLPCCTGTFCNGQKCVPCSSNGGPCRFNSECCNAGEICLNKICKTCVKPRGLCNAGAPCCEKSECRNGNCEECGTLGLPCDEDSDCCKEYHCKPMSDSYYWQCQSRKKP